MIKFLSTGFYSGLFTKMPGTIGSLVALLPIIFLKSFFSSPWDVGYITITFILCIIGVPICQHASDKIFKKEDPKEVVIDEFAGMFIATIPIFHTDFSYSLLFQYVIAFVFFRIFDILKPYPISYFDSLPGGLGIMLDDIAAGFVSMFFVLLYGYLFI